MNKLIKLKNVGYKIDDNNFIKNLNLNFYSGENVLISGKNSVISNLMIDLIAGFIKPQIGNVTSQSFNEKRYFIGYNNFESVLKYGAQVEDIINTLVSSQRYLINDKNEVNELIGLFSLNNTLKKSTNELLEDDVFLLNLLMLLIVKPRIIILKKLPLLGSENFKLSTLKYIYNYAKKYDISLITTVDSKIIIENLIDRQLKIENGKIISDVSKSIIANYETNQVDNNTKEFNLENVLISALDHSFIENDLADSKSIIDSNQNNSKNINQTKQIEIDIPINNSKTKTVKIEFDEHLNNIPPTINIKQFENEEGNNQDVFNYNKVIDDLNNTTSISENKSLESKNISETRDGKFNSTINLKNTTNIFLSNDNNSIKFNTSALENDDENDELNNSSIMDENRCEIVTKKLNNITREFENILLQDNTDSYSNKINQAQIQIIETRSNEALNLKNELDAQVKNPEFVNLPINLQSQILDNLERANKILDENTQKLTSKLYSDDSITKMIIDEDDKTGSITADNYDKLRTRNIDDSDITNEKSDLFYYDNEKPNSLYDLWRKKRNIKINKRSDQLASTLTNDLDSSVNITEQIDNYTTNLKLGNEDENTHELEINYDKLIEPEQEIVEPVEIKDSTSNIYLDLGINNTVHINNTVRFINDDFKANNEPTKELFEELQRIEINSNTGIFNLPESENKHDKNITNDLNEKSDVETKNKSDVEIKTFIAKPRSKLNSIEKLYQEALEDLNIVEEQKNKNKLD